MKKIREYLEERLKKELPGEQAHVQMAPIQRPLAAEARLYADTKNSAVLILLYPHRERIFTALMMRPEYQGVHSNQVSFPGGRREEGDADIRATAIREAEEELGLLGREIEIIGNLSELYIPPSKSLVTPVIAFAEKRPEFKTDEREVRELIEADVFEMFEERHFNNTEVVTSGYLMKQVPAILYKGYTIWGATAMILNEFKWILKDYRQ